MGALLHADLFAVDVDKAIEVKVPVRIVGTPTGVTFGGGILDFPLREIEVLCLPRAIPEELPIDVAALQVGDSIHVRDIALPAGVELVSDPDCRWSRSCCRRRKRRRRRSRRSWPRVRSRCGGRCPRRGGRRRGSRGRVAASAAPQVARS
jgi:hypothetical protein